MKKKLRLHDSFVLHFTFLFFVFLISSSYIVFRVFFTPEAPVLPKNEADTMFAMCRSVNDKATCYSRHFASITKYSSLNKAVTVLNEIKKKDPYTLYCHSYAHTISSTEVAKDPSNWLKILQRVSLSDCTRGFFHGAIEGYTRYNPEFQLDEKTIPKLCSQASNAIQNTDPEFTPNQTCIHAIGHVLLVQEEADVKKSIALCKKLSPDLRFDCYVGVFMENQSKDNLFAHGLVKSKNSSWTEEDTVLQEKICSQYSYSEEIGKACWQTIGPMFGLLTGDDTTTLVQRCSNAIKQQNIDECLYTAFSFKGFLLATRNDDVNKMLNICSEYNKNEAKRMLCNIRAIEYILTASYEYTPYVIELCSRSKPLQTSETCFSYAASKIAKNFQIENKSMVCGYFPEKYRDQCFAGDI